jgi:hypothetical protein
VDDKKIFDDLRELSHGRLKEDLNFLKLTESKEILNKNSKNNGKKGVK